MDFDEFKDLVTRIVGNFDRYPSSWEGKDAFFVDRNMIIQKHEAGGAHGGNCYGDSAEYYRNEKKTQEFLPLDEILKEVAPKISYLKYREIQTLIKEDSDTDSEYYGNYTEYDLYKLDIHKLYDMIFSND